MILKTIFYAIAVFWFGVFTYIGIEIFKQTPEIIERNKIFLHDTIMPLVDYVENFKKTNGRLPTLIEFNSSLNIPSNEYETYIRDPKFVPTEIAYEVQDLDWSNNYVIVIWRGEWFEFYISDRKRDSLNNFDCLDGLRNLVITIIIGVIPLFGVKFYYIKHKKI